MGFVVTAAVSSALSLPRTTNRWLRNTPACSDTKCPCHSSYHILLNTNTKKNNRYSVEVQCTPTPPVLCYRQSHCYRLSPEKNNALIYDWLSPLLLYTHKCCVVKVGESSLRFFSLRFILSFMNRYCSGPGSNMFGQIWQDTKHFACIIAGKMLTRRLLNCNNLRN